jgi:hypothetical protein
LNATRYPFIEIPVHVSDVPIKWISHINKRSCHFVDEVTEGRIETPSLYSSYYTDFAVPLRQVFIDNIQPAPEIPPAPIIQSDDSKGYTF